MARSRFCFVLGFFLVLALAANARAQSDNAAREQCGTLFTAQVCTSYRMKAGKITEIVLRVPIAMIQHAPANPPMVGPPRPDLDVPFAPVVQKQTGFTFASIWWEAHGHPPPAFMVPHFDVHFYFAPQQEVKEVDCKNTVKPPAIPAGYILPDITDPHFGVMVGACVPNMGMHALPVADLSLKTPWKASMMVGYYGGKATFFEPMIATKALLQKQSFTLPVPQDIAPVPDVRYPRQFKAVYVPQSKAYDLTFFF